MAELSATLIPLNDKLYKHFKGFTEVYSIGSNQFCLPKHGPRIINQLQQFKAKDDDVYVISFTKTGTTWLQEIVYNLRNNLDFEKAGKEIRDEVFPYADINVWEGPEFDQIAVVNNLPSPRHVKFHLNYFCLPPDVVSRCKMLYVCRNVKDTIVSNYHFTLGMKQVKFDGSIDDYVDLFLENKIPYAPYIAHVREFWERRHEKNIFFTTYEDLQKNQEKVIADIAKFLNIPISNEEIKLLADHCKFDNMKKNPTVNKSHWDERFWEKDFQFMRKGVVGSWQNELSPQTIDRINKWIYEQTIDNPDLREIL